MAGKENTDLPTRRTALTALGAAIVLPALPAAALSPNDQRLLAIATQMPAAAAAQNAIDDRYDAAHARYETEKPQKPDALRWRLTDPPCIGYTLERLPNGKGRMWCRPSGIEAARTSPPVQYHFIGTEQEAEQIKDDDFDSNFVPYKPKAHIEHLYRAETDPREQARVNEIIAAYDRHEDECRVLAETLGLTELARQSDEAADRLFGLYHEATAIETSTIVGLQAKASILLAYEWRKGIDHEDNEVGDMLRSIVAGLAGGGEVSC